MKPPYREETIPVLNDKIMKELGYKPASLSEKIDYVESWILKVNREMESLERNLTTAKIGSGATQYSAEYYKHRIERKKQERKGYQNRLNEYKKIQREQQLKADGGKDIPDDIKKAIHLVALEISKKSNINDYEKISSALCLYYSSDLNGKQVADKKGIPPNTLSTWKSKLDDKL